MLCEIVALKKPFFEGGDHGTKLCESTVSKMAAVHQFA